MTTVVFDNEAIGALADVRHPHHRAALAYVEVVAQRGRKGAAVTALVPTAVRVEADWDRTDQRFALINRLRISDAALDTRAANRAASLHKAVGVSVADAHVAAVALSVAGRDTVTVVTSDPNDIRRLTDPAPVVIAKL